ncbi:dodecin family protein [Aurantiacibacter aquimixticola]|uniref:Dodecin domain-containing protein n=1 Tax=Aurantiacibacter aquimixticola TaxID=1958945 RepID=A0A419RSR0_9SPHN|nr:dodecin family protein [Aurantiacibacter aquimixticola]RJY08818.1 dodecin domain-containing protein [Aurantiacibacter aquimixticola]
MSVAKVTEIISSSAVGIEDAVKSGVARASKTLNGITGVWVSDIKCTVNDNAITEWRCTLKVTFVLND